MPDEDKTKEELIALRGSTEESIKAIEDEIKKLDKKKVDKPPDKTKPDKPDPQVSEEYQQFIDEKETFLKDKKDFEKQQRESLLEPFSKEEREAYKDLSIKELALITKDRENRKKGIFLTEPPASPDPMDKVAIGWGQTEYGYGWYNAKGEILSKERASPYGVKKENG